MGIYKRMRQFLQTQENHWLRKERRRTRDTNPDELFLRQEAGIMQCPICGSLPREWFRSPYVTVLKCGSERCGHLYADSPAPDQGLQQHPDPEADRTLYAERNRHLVRYWIRQGFIGEGTAVLDIGSGVGHIAETITGTLPSAHVTCVERAPCDATHLRERGFEVLDDLPPVERRFSAFLLIELIEHVADPVQLLVDCRRRATPNAQIFITTPCGETASGSRKTSAYDTKEHVQFFTERSFWLACELADLAAPRFVDPGIMYGPVHDVVGAAKSVLRPVRDALMGRHHLVAFVHV